MSEPITKDKDERAKLIEHMLGEVEGHLDDLHRTNDFIESIRDQFDRWGTLTDNQIEAVRKFYGRI